ncbi:B12-binding domain-containing radical SAM protein [Blastochloris viridis]|nr:radical SAM protein [Blastochloris viridis]ALK08135.1 B12 binding domain protein [Blastochloris viridis]CUU44057.1 magnesium-protoporphyrin IX monomethyl ester anaerobic oxidative cyclase [Blastochloris viridis]
MEWSDLTPRIELSRPRPLRVALPVLLCGDLVDSPEHLGPAYIAAVLRAAGAEVAIIEAELDRDDDALAEIIALRPDIVGIGLTTVAVEPARRFGARLRAALGPAPLIVGGGAVATHLGATLLTNSGWQFLDAVVRGEGEIPMLRLAETVHGGGDLGAVPSLCWRRADGTIAETAIQRGASDLDRLPFPARDQLARHGGRLPYVRLSTSRGCTGRCAFCNAPHSRNGVGPAAKPWRGASPRRIVDEIAALVGRFGCNTFDFIDSTFEDPGGGEIGKARVRAIAEEIIARNLRIYFNVFMQAQNWSAADQPLLELLWRAGLEKVCVGIESGNDADLERWHKRSRLADNTRIIALLRRLGVHVAFGFIAFHPWSSFDTVRANHAFLRDHVGHNLRRFTVRLELYPGAEVVETLASAGMLSPDFHQTLNPYAYRYRDERIQRLASCLSAIFDEEYSHNSTLREVPAVFRFETYDIVLHNFISRIARAYPGDGVAGDILAGFRTELAAIKHEMARHNFALVCELTDRAETGRLEVADARRWAAPTQRLFLDRIEQIERLKMRYGLRLRRHGIDVAAIAAASQPARISA